jgi:hypothetical protein
MQSGVMLTMKKISMDIYNNNYYNYYHYLRYKTLTRSFNPAGAYIFMICMS